MWNNVYLMLPFKQEWYVEYLWINTWAASNVSSI